MEIAVLRKNAQVGTNLFAYCDNNSTNNSDPKGYWVVRAAVAAASGAIWGIKILTKINKLIKPVIYWFSNPGKVYFGLKLLNKVQFELHNPHHGKGIHFVIRIFTSGRGKVILEYIFRR